MLWLGIAMLHIAGVESGEEVVMRGSDLGNDVLLRLRADLGPFTSSLAKLPYLVLPLPVVRRTSSGGDGRTVCCLFPYCLVSYRGVDLKSPHLASQRLRSPRDNFPFPQGFLFCFMGSISITDWYRKVSTVGNCLLKISTTRAWEKLQLKSYLICRALAIILYLCRDPAWDSAGDKDLCRMQLHDRGYQSQTL